MMPNLWRDFPELSDFFIAYIGLADVDGFESDIEVVQDIVRTEHEAFCTKIVKQGRALLSETPFPWQDVMNLANRGFDSTESAQAWLQELIEEFETNFEKGH